MPGLTNQPAFPIVGVGASAGGLEAFTRLLSSLPSDTGLGFVLVQHLDPQHESALTQILTRATSMPVREVTNDLKIEPDHVYIIPPNRNLAIAEGVFKLVPRPQTSGAHRSIDFFLESLAQDRRESAIGVILSGTATDGTVGLEAIKAEGGITFAQDDSAKYDSMPRSAAAAGCVDFVLKPEDIASELARIARHPFVVSPLAVAPPAAGQQREPAAPGSERSPASRSQGPLTGDRPRAKVMEDGFRKILLLLRNHSGVDFSLYKSTTITRRVTRRMVLNKKNTLNDYAAFLRGNAKELDALYSDALISVTSFFRNREAFEFLKHEVFPKFLHQRGDDPLRVWVLGCSTGQEAYSIAMAYVEAAEKATRSRKLQVFATDLNDVLLDRARHGLYARTLVQDIAPERLRRFFVEEEGGWRIIKPLREMVVFARQNLITDPPFSRMDLISCRNLLIYLEPSLQQKAMPTFHYALKPGGFLFLGASESIGRSTELFEPADKKHRIYCRKAAPAVPLPLPVHKDRSLQSTPAPRPGLTTARKKAEPPEGARAGLDPQREADRLLVNQFAPPGVLINAEFQILQFRGPTRAYLEPPTGKATFDVLKMAREGLMLPLRAAITKARKENRTIRTEHVRIEQNGKGRKVNIEVIPLKNLRERCFLILFEDARQAGQAVAAEAPPEHRTGRPGKKHESRRRASLERELAETRDYLQAIHEQYEAANEELQASNEEVQSANEELQSLNEELETSKEELESSNEELTTVNEEMAHRNAELRSLNSDLVNLQTSTHLAIVLVSRDLAIRRFSSQAERQFGLLATDIGRPFTAVRHGLELPDLEAFLGRVIATVREQEREVQDKAGRWYSLRARPYVTLDNKVDGAVLVLVDINDLKRSENEAKAARDYAEATIRTARDPLVILRADLRVDRANDAFYKTFKVTPPETENVLMYQLDGGQWNIPKLRELLEEIITLNTVFNDFEVTHDFERLGRRTMLLNARRLQENPSAHSPRRAREEAKPERRARILLAIEDVTERKAAEHALRRAEEVRAKLASIVESSDDAIVSKDLNGIITSWNSGAERLFGYTAKEAIGQSVRMLIPPDRLDEEPSILARIRRGEAIEHFETVRRRKDGALLDLSLTVSPVRNSEGEVVGASKIARDITLRKKAEKTLRDSQAALADHAGKLEQLVSERTARLQDTIDELEHFSYTITHDMRAPLRAVQGFGGMLLSEHKASLTPEVSEYLARIMGAARRMDCLITDSLQYAKVVREKIPLGTVEPAPILRGILESYPTLQRPRVDIQIIEPLPPVIANEAGLAQCFSNLLINAVKFMKPHVAPQVRIWAEIRPSPNLADQESMSPSARQPGSVDVVRFWFEDNGIGIPPKYQDRIFDMFQQLDKSSEGTGIGLALVRKTSQRMEGRVGVESEVGKGSRFWLEFKKADLPIQ